MQQIVRQNKYIYAGVQIAIPGLINHLREMDISALLHRCGNSWKIGKALVYLIASPGVPCIFVFIYSFISQRMGIPFTKTKYQNSLFVFKLQCFTVTVVHLAIAPSLLRSLPRLFAIVQGFLPSQCSKDCMLKYNMYFHRQPKLSKWLTKIHGPLQHCFQVKYMVLQRNIQIGISVNQWYARTCSYKIDILQKQSTVCY